MLVSDGSAGTAANAENLLEERDPKFDSMLNQMVGRIKSKPGGKPEMGEVGISMLFISCTKITWWPQFLNVLVFDCCIVYMWLCKIGYRHKWWRGIRDHYQN